MVHEEEELASAQHGAAFPHRHRATHPIGHSALGDPPAVDEDSQPRSTDSIAGIGRHALHQGDVHRQRSEEHTSELQSLMRISYAVFCLKKKKTRINTTNIIK